MAAQDRSASLSQVVSAAVSGSTTSSVSLSGTLVSRLGPQNARVWDISVTNDGPGTADNAVILSFTLTQTAGAACTPVVTPPAAYPVSLGTLAPGASADGFFTIDFTGCPNLARFTLQVLFSPDGGGTIQSMTRYNLFR